ncbi:peroxisomal membrane protein pex14 [Coemansia sp. RSA 1752]|nr:peroxisomal membrane protein pex14 [Coemansia sp. RSA 1752]
MEAPHTESGTQAVLREDVIESAVRFLMDPKVNSSTLAKKVSFLESKGLTNAEIEDALARAKNTPRTSESNTTATSATTGPGYGYAQAMRPPAPARPALDWKDFFIAAVVAGGLGYGLILMVKKYVGPLLMARDDVKRLEEEKKQQTEQNELTRKQLQVLSESTTRILDTMAEQSRKTAEAIEGMALVMDDIATNESAQRSQAGRLLVAVEDLQREISAQSVQTAKAGNATIADVQSDVRSLRSLLLSRRVPAHSMSPAVRPSTPSAFTAVPSAEASEVSPNDTNGSPLVSSVEDASKDEGNLSTGSTPTPTIPAWQLGLADDNDKGKAAE